MECKMSRLAAILVYLSPFDNISTSSVILPEEAPADSTWSRPWSDVHTHSSSTLLSHPLPTLTSFLCLLVLI